jgi:hypothetical protein
MGFQVYVILDACRGVDVPDGNVEKSIDTMKSRNINIVQSRDLLNG